MRRMAAALVFLGIAVGGGAARAEDLRQVHLEQHRFLNGPKGEPVELRPRPHGGSYDWMTVAPVDAPGRRGGKDGPSVAVLVSGNPNVVLWVERASLSPLVKSSVTLAPSAAAVGQKRRPDAPGVTLGQGLLVKELERSGKAVHVSYESPTVSVEGWVPASALDQVRPQPTLDRSWSLEPDGPMLPAEAEILVAPGGAPLVRLRQPRSLGGVRFRTGAVDKEHVKVEWSHDGVTVVGWVAQASLVKAPAGQDGAGGSFGIDKRKDPGSSLSTGVDAGAEVYDRPGGVMIGRFLEAGRVEVLETRDGYRRFEIVTLVGTLAVWLAPAKAAPTP